MNPHDSLLGHLASRLSAHPENVATEALAFILRQNEYLRQAVLRFLEGLGVPPPQVVSFSAQQSEENAARPDLRGADKSGAPVLFIEAKFWAGLTDHQPVSYLRALPSDRPTTLLFIVPEARRQMLWRELLVRCKEGFQESAAFESERQSVAQVGPNRFLAISAWKPFLESLQSAALSQGDRVSSENLNQLLGLCTREDTTAFLPLRQEELSAGIGQRIFQFGALVDEVCESAVEQKICVRGPSGGSKLSYYRTVRLAGHDFYFYLSPWRWHTLAETPFWLEFPSDRNSWDDLLQALHPLALQSPPMILRDPSWRDTPVIPLHPKLGVEHHEVIQGMVDRLRNIRDLIPASPP
ncbi:hypothetical protein D7X74_40105 [Corallococcus sp. CA047B]|uniref:hypothetical protein n=1 Tax=Corallococcus sp. CA047B TaxID=2316729 RepID=UPI000EA311A4|nr:hypothetical protein [Corallococcus sp. CA047B]RKG98605.1 hypothetical protein D7X74_40105 [Corallococcus sp. CA047B]